MYCLSKFCFLCLNTHPYLRNINSCDNDNKTFLYKLSYCSIDVEYAVNVSQVNICRICCDILRAAFEFKRICLINNKRLNEYIQQLENKSSDYVEAIVILNDDQCKQYEDKTTYNVYKSLRNGGCLDNNVGCVKNVPFYSNLDDQRQLCIHPKTKSVTNTNITHCDFKKNSSFLQSNENVAQCIALFEKQELLSNTNNVDSWLYPSSQKVLHQNDKAKNCHDRVSIKQVYVVLERISYVTKSNSDKKSEDKFGSSQTCDEKKEKRMKLMKKKIKLYKKRIKRITKLVSVLKKLFSTQQFKNRFRDRQTFSKIGKKCRKCISYNSRVSKLREENENYPSSSENTSGTRITNQNNCAQQDIPVFKRRVKRNNLENMQLSEEINTNKLGDSKRPKEKERYCLNTENISQKQITNQKNFDGELRRPFENNTFKNKLQDILLFQETGSDNSKDSEWLGDKESYCLSTENISENQKNFAGVSRYCFENCAFRTNLEDVQLYEGTSSDDSRGSEWMKEKEGYCSSTENTSKEQITNQKNRESNPVFGNSSIKNSPKDMQLSKEISIANNRNFQLSNAKGRQGSSTEDITKKQITRHTNYTDDLHSVCKNNTPRNNSQDMHLPEEIRYYSRDFELSKDKGHNLITENTSKKQFTNQKKCVDKLNVVSEESAFGKNLENMQTSDRGFETYTDNDINSENIKRTAQNRKKNDLKIENKNKNKQFNNQVRDVELTEVIFDKQQKDVNMLIKKQNCISNLKLEDVSSEKQSDNKLRNTKASNLIQEKVSDFDNTSDNTESISDNIKCIFKSISDNKEKSIKQIKEKHLNPGKVYHETEICITRKKAGVKDISFSQQFNDQLDNSEVLKDLLVEYSNERVENQLNDSQTVKKTQQECSSKEISKNSSTNNVDLQNKEDTMFTLEISQPKETSLPKESCQITNIHETQLTTKAFLQKSVAKFQKLTELREKIKYTNRRKSENFDVLKELLVENSNKRVENELNDSQNTQKIAEECSSSSKDGSTNVVVLQNKEDNKSTLETSKLKETSLPKKLCEIANFHETQLMEKASFQKCAAKLQKLKELREKTKYVDMRKPDNFGLLKKLLAEDSNKRVENQLNDSQITQKLEDECSSSSKDGSTNAVVLQKLVPLETSMPKETSVPKESCEIINCYETKFMANAVIKKSAVKLQKLKKRRKRMKYVNKRKSLEKQIDEENSLCSDADLPQIIISPLIKENVIDSHDTRKKYVSKICGISTKTDFENLIDIQISTLEKKEQFNKNSSEETSHLVSSYSTVEEMYIQKGSETTKCLEKTKLWQETCNNLGSLAANDTNASTSELVRKKCDEWQKCKRRKQRYKNIKYVENFEQISENETIFAIKDTDMSAKDKIKMESTAVGDDHFETIKFPDQFNTSCMNLDENTERTINDEGDVCDYTRNEENLADRMKIDFDDTLQNMNTENNFHQFEINIIPEQVSIIKKEENTYENESVSICNKATVEREEISSNKKMKIIDKSIQPVPLSTLKHSDKYSSKKRKMDETKQAVEQKTYGKKRIWSCSSCEKTFTIESRLKLHLIAHSNNKLFTCPICSSKYKYKYNMTRHMANHNKLK